MRSLSSVLLMSSTSMAEAGAFRDGGAWEISTMPSRLNLRLVGHEWLNVARWYGLLRAPCLYSVGKVEGGMKKMLGVLQ